MTDRDRLIELFQIADCDNDEKANCNECKYKNEYSCLYAKLADYLLANGVIVPPCKVGQTVYYVDDYVEEIEECKVYGFTVVNGKLSLLVDNGECKFVTRKWHNTKEEAEEKLRGLKEQCPIN